MFDKKILGLVGGVGSANLIVTLILSLGLATGTPGPSGLPGSNGENGLPGSVGESGLPGSNGENGQTPFIGENGNWWIGTTDTGVPATGPAGENGGGSTTILDTIDFYVPDLDLKEDSITPKSYENNFDEVTFLEQFQALTFEEISTEAELRAISGGGNYRLMNDITLTSPFTMIGTELSFFTVNFDGNGYAIENLDISDSSSLLLGMFPNVLNSAFVNLTLTSPSLLSESSNTDSGAGILAGIATSSVFYNITVTGGEALDISGAYNTGSLVGKSSENVFSNITINNVSVKGYRHVGGLAGSDEASTFDTINGTQVNVTPLFGAEPLATINNYKEGFGGLVGVASGASNYVNIAFQDVTLDAITGSFIEDPFNLGQGLSLNFEGIGGLIGTYRNASYNEDGALFNNISLNNVFVVGRYDVGGLIGSVEDGLYFFQNIVATGSYVMAGSEDNAFPNLTPIPVEFFDPTEANLLNLKDGAGGLIGYAYNAGILFYNIVNQEGVVFGDYSVGGILGEMEYDYTEQTQIYFKNVLNASNVYAYYDVGGFAGVIDSGTSFFVIENSANHGIIQALNENGSNFGGFVGNVYEVEYVGLISNSYNSASVFGNDNVGGFIGYNEIENVSNHSMTEGGLILYNTFNIGDVYGNSNVGGFLGVQYSQENTLDIFNSLQAGEIRMMNGDFVEIENGEHGMFIGENDDSSSLLRIHNSFYLNMLDVNDNNLPAYGYNIGSTTSYLPLTGLLIASINGGVIYAIDSMDAFTLANDAFLFAGLWDFESVWYLNEATQLPDLIALNTLD